MPQQRATQHRCTLLPLVVMKQSLDCCSSEEPTPGLYRYRHCLVSLLWAD